MAARTRRDYQRQSRKRAQASTSSRGYGRAHQAERERRLAAYRPGDLCAHGGEPMWWWPLKVARRYLHLPHTPDRSGYLDGLSCARHNIAEGNLRRGQPGTWQASRAPACEGCGKRSFYAARTCQVCGAHYHPSGSRQRTCGRACGRALQLLSAAPRPAPPLSACEICGYPAVRGRRTCGLWVCAQKLQQRTKEQNGTCGPMTLRPAKLRTSRQR